MNTGTMTERSCAGLLVSVRDVAEATLALAAGVDLIDIKEPDRGPLGAAEPAVIADIVQRVHGHVPVSAALGEVLDYDVTSARNLPAGLSFAKFGLAGCGEQFDWPRTWARVLEALPQEVEAVAVVYADWSAARAPAPSAVLRHATALNCRAVLVDTFDKSQGGLLDYWSLAELAEFIHSVRESGMLSVLAGSLSLETIPEALALRPDFIALRGAACRGGRTQHVDTECLARLVNLVHSA